MEKTSEWELESEGRIIRKFTQDNKEHTIILDTDGNEIIDLTDKYDDCDHVFYSGRLKVKTYKTEIGGRQLLGRERFVGYVDLDGNEIIPPKFIDGERFLCGRAVVEICDWQKLRSEGNKLVTKNERCGIIDENGNTVVPFIYRSIDFLYGFRCSCCSHKPDINNSAEALYIVREMGKNGKEGIINGNGEWILEPKFPKYSIRTDKDGKFMARKCLIVQTAGRFNKKRAKQRFGVYSLEKNDWVIEPMKLPLGDFYIKWGYFYDALKKGDKLMGE